MHMGTDGERIFTKADQVAALIGEIRHPLPATAGARERSVRQGQGSTLLKMAESGHPEYMSALSKPENLKALQHMADRPGLVQGHALHAFWAVEAHMAKPAISAAQPAQVIEMPAKPLDALREGNPRRAASVSTMVLGMGRTA